MIWQLAEPNGPRLLIQVAFRRIAKLVQCFQITEYLRYALATNSQVLFANRHYSLLQICCWATRFRSPGNRRTANPTSALNGGGLTLLSDGHSYATARIFWTVRSIQAGMNNNFCDT